MTRPLIVCLCGSTRFTELFQKAELEETLKGSIVLTVGCSLQPDTELFKSMTPEQLRLTKAKLDVLHFHKIDLADEILVLNEDGYIGESTEREIIFAASLGKRIRYYNDGYEKVCI